MSNNPFRILRHRDYALFWSAAVVSDIGTWMQAVTVGIIVADETGRASSTGLIAAAAFIPQAIAAPVGGVIADRFDRRNVLRVALGVQTMITVALAVLLTADHPSITWMAIIVFCQGTANASGQPALQAMLPDLVPRDELISAVALGIVSWNSGRIVGPALAGIIINFASPSLVVQINAVSFVVLLGAVSTLRRPFRAPPGTIHLGFVASLKVGVAAVRNTPSLAMAAKTAATFQFGLIGLVGLLPIVAKNVFDRGAGLASLLTTGQGIGALIGATLAPSIVAHFGRSRSILVLATATAALMAVAPSTHWPALAVITMVVYGITMMATFVGIIGAAQRDAPTETRARILSLFNGGFGLMYGVSVIGMGWAGDHFGLRRAIAVWALVAVAMLMNLAWRGRRTWTLLDHSDPAPLRNAPRHRWS